MSHYMTALAMRQTGLKPATKIVLYWLADHHNSETGACFPSLKKLAEECEMDRATVKRHLAALQADGLISREHRKRENGSYTSTSYILHLGAECTHPRRKMHPGVGAKCAPHNLGNTNLGNEPFAIDAVSVFDAFNEIAQRVGWPRVQKQSRAREKAASERIKECGGFENWKAAMERAASSDFLSGKATGTTPACFDWLNSPKNFTKLMEGNYDNRNSNTGRSGSCGSGNAMVDAFASVAAERAARNGRG